MEFKIHSQILSSIVKKFSPILASKGMIEGHGNIFLNAKGNKLQVFGENTSVGLLLNECDVSIIKDGKVVIDFLVLKEISSHTKDNVLFKTSDKLEIVNKSTKWKFELLQQKSKFPGFPKNNTNKVVLKTNELNIAINHTSYSVCKDMARVELNQLATSSGYLVGTDGIRCSMYKTKLDLAIPEVAIQSLVTLLDIFDDKDVSIISSKSHTYFLFPSNVYYFRKYNANFPDIKESVLNLVKDYDMYIEVNRERFIDTLGRIDIAIYKDPTTPVDIIVSNGKHLIVKSVSNTVKSVAKIPVRLEGISINIRVRLKHLTDALNKLSSKNVKIFYAGSSKPLYIKADKYKIVILPMEKEDEK